ncbi:unnamed protein product [Brassica oleracea]
MWSFSSSISLLGLISKSQLELMTTISAAVVSPVRRNQNFSTPVPINQDRPMTMILDLEL